MSHAILNNSGLIVCLIIQMGFNDNHMDASEDPVYLGLEKKFLGGGLQSMTMVKI